jgi:hypothetical protein
MLDWVRRDPAAAPRQARKHPDFREEDWVGESLLELGRFDSQDIVGRYLRWWREGAFDTGPVSGRALELMVAGMSAPDASAPVHQQFGGKTAG